MCLFFDYAHEYYISFTYKKKLYQLLSDDIIDQHGDMATK